MARLNSYTLTEKMGFFTRLFGGKKGGKTRQSLCKSRTVESDMSSGHGANIYATQTPLTFSAQFPPAEWLPDARHMQATLKSNAHKKQRMWVDPNLLTTDVESSVAEYNPKPRKVHKVKHHEQLIAMASPRRARKARQSSKQRPFSKYLSSSSECLHFLGPVDPPELLPGTYTSRIYSHSLKTMLRL